LTGSICWCALEERGLAWTGIVLGCISVLGCGVLLYLAYR